MDWFNNADIKLQVVIISSLTSIAIFLLGWLIKVIYERNSLNYKLKKEYQFEQKKKLKEEIAKNKMHLLNSAEELNHRLWNFSQHVDENWHKGVIGIVASRLTETYYRPTLVFTKTKYGAKKVAHQIRDLGVRSSEIHSNRTLGQRREALDGFKSGRYRVLVATDIASRGIDVTGIELVLNYDLPSTSDDYVHRIGRTARAGTKGHAITFAMVSEGKEVRAIERAIQKRLATTPLPEGFTPAPKLQETPRSPRPQRGRGGRSRGPRQRHSGFGR